MISTIEPVVALMYEDSQKQKKQDLYVKLDVKLLIYIINLTVHSKESHMHPLVRFILDEICSDTNLTSCPSIQIQRAPSPSSSMPSVWQGFGRKVRLLLPYVWPRGAPALQGLVLLCVGLLLAERLVNVLVPVYSKNIGKQPENGKRS